MSRHSHCRLVVKMPLVAIIGSSHVKRLQENIQENNVKEKGTVLHDEYEITWWGKSGMSISWLLSPKAEDFKNALLNARPQIAVLILGSNDLDSYESPSAEQVAAQFKLVVTWLYEVVGVRRVVAMPLFCRREGPRISRWRFKYPGRRNYNEVHHHFNSLLHDLYPPVEVGRYLPIDNSDLLPNDDCHMDTHASNIFMRNIIKAVMSLVKW